MCTGQWSFVVNNETPGYVELDVETCIHARNGSGCRCAVLLHLFSLAPPPRSPREKVRRAGGKRERAREGEREQEGTKEGR